MAKTNREFMQIPKEYLEPKNYDGTRLVEITDKRILDLKAKLAEFKPIAKPHLEVIEKLSVILDPYFTKIREHQGAIDKIKEEMQKTKDEFDAELKKMEAIEQKTDLIKNKIQPLVAQIMKDKLGEFETARQLIEKDDKLFVEVIDEIEEKIKAIRASKMK